MQARSVYFCTDFGMKSVSGFEPIKYCKTRSYVQKDTWCVDIFLEKTYLNMYKLNYSPVELLVCRCGLMSIRDDVNTVL